MMTKGLILVLALLLLAGMIGKFLRPKPPPGGDRVEAARKCASCGIYVIGSGACGRAGCPQIGGT